MDLYLQTLGLGVCWLGMGKMNPKSAPEVEGFRRKHLEQIADRADPRLEPAWLAPSSVNSQPWHFTHDGETIHVYCIRKDTIGYMNRICFASTHLTTIPIATK